MTTFGINGTDTTCHIEYSFENALGYLVTISVSATAHLHKEDKYDEKKGRKIAYYKAKEKFNWKLYSEYNKEWYRLDFLKDRIDKKSNRAFYAAKEITDKLEKGVIE